LENRKVEKINLYRSIWFPFLFIIIIWIIKCIEYYYDISFADYGLVPLDITGLRGILFMPLVHANFEHLFNNSISLFLLSWALFYFYRSIAFNVFFLSWFIHGFWLWFFGRESFHIGASGIVYSLSSFLFVSGLIRKNSHLLAISLLVAFLYGSMVWGIFPLAENVSWEAHLTGMFAGIVLAFYYKDYGPPANIRQWKNDYPDEEDPDADKEAYWNAEEYKEEDHEIHKRDSSD
jgi:membrane associated rhomboid family serine protease